MIDCFYANRKKNFGDMLVPIILDYVSFNSKINHVKGTTENKLLCIGSGLNKWLKNGDTVWGYGSRNEDVFGKIPTVEHATFLACRGRWTYENAKKANPHLNIPEIFGDPASIMPLIYKPKSSIKRYKIGLISHYIDVDRFHVLSPDIKKINVLGNPYQVIDDICSCDVIISTSMHGIIVSDAYKVPNVWLQVSDKVLGGYFKFNDYFSSVGRKETSPNKKMHGTIKSKYLFSIADNVLDKPKINVEPLIEAWKGYGI